MDNHGYTGTVPSINKHHEPSETRKPYFSHTFLAKQNDIENIATWHICAFKHFKSRMDPQRCHISNPQSSHWNASPVFLGDSISKPGCPRNVRQNGWKTHENSMHAIQSWYRFCLKTTGDCTYQSECVGKYLISGETLYSVSFFLLTLSLTHHTTSRQKTLGTLRFQTLHNMKL